MSQFFATMEALSTEIEKNLEALIFKGLNKFEIAGIIIEATSRSEATVKHSNALISEYLTVEVDKIENYYRLSDLRFFKFLVRESIYQSLHIKGKLIRLEYSSYLGDGDYEHYHEYIVPDTTLEPFLIKFTDNFQIYLIQKNRFFALGKTKTECLYNFMNYPQQVRDNVIEI